MNTATNKISANSLQLHEISANSLLSRYGKSALAATAISVAGTYSIGQSDDWGNALNLQSYPASVVNVEKIKPQIDYDKDLPHNNEKKNQRTEDNAMNSTGEFTAKDYIDARQNAYEKSVDSRLDRFEKKIDEYRKETKEEMKAFINEMKADNKSTRTTTIVTAITTVISIVGGIAAFNSSLISNMQQSYGMGKEGAVIQQKVVSLEQRMDGLEQRMNSVESKLDKIIEQTAK